MSKVKSSLWKDAVKEAQIKLANVRNAADELEAALEAIRDVQEEYEEWKDELSDRQANSALGEKLEAICELDFNLEVDVDDIESVLEDAEGVELP